MDKKRKRKYISIETEVDVYIKDIIEDIEDDDLIEEMKSRNLDYKDVLVPSFKTREDTLNFIKFVLGLKSYHDNERVLTEIKDLF